MSSAKVIYFNNQVSGYDAVNIIDNDPNTFWHTPWDGNVSKYPHEIQIDLGEEISITGFSLLPRQDEITGGWISKGEFYISMNGKDWGTPVASSNFTYDKNKKEVMLKSPTSARYIRFVALQGFQSQDFASL